MKRLVYLALLSMTVMVISAPAALAQQEDLDCADFSSQEEAQANLNANPDDPNNLDADGDDIACETLSNGIMEDSVTEDDNNGDGSVADEQYNEGDVASNQYDNGGVADDGDVTALPDTGGPSIVLIGASLLMGAGILGLAVLRRRSE